MKYYIIAGEASGDLHGSNLMKALLRKDSTWHPVLGGDLMQETGDNGKALSRISLHGICRSTI
jgi:lipid-A-disaccharide synthase